MHISSFFLKKNKNEIPQKTKTQNLNQIFEYPLSNNPLFGEKNSIDKKADSKTHKCSQLDPSKDPSS